MDKYPVQALAIYMPDFKKLETRSSQILRTDEWGALHVTQNATSGSSVVVYGITSNGQEIPLSVNADGTVNVAFDNSPGVQKGACTNEGGTGYTSYSDAGFTLLDSISLVAGNKLEIHGLHAFGNAQAEVDLIFKDGPSETRLLVGGVSESIPNWDPPFGAPIEVMATGNQQVQLLIRGLRANRTGDGTGRIFARLV